MRIRAVQHFSAVARELGVVLPISFFERAGPAYFNSIAILDADGSRLGIYRKSHIPNGPGYQEKNYFSPGDTGFKVWRTRYARIGVGICWDQWFPEAARAMALAGAEILLYPTAIGTEPPPALPVNSRDHWQRTQQGHAAANLMPLVAANRYGLERSLQDPEGLYIRFYGSSFIADAMGAKVAEAAEEGDAVLTASFDLEQTAAVRDNWFVFRDRRPDLYGALDVARWDQCFSIQATASLSSFTKRAYSLRRCASSGMRRRNEGWMVTQRCAVAESLVGEPRSCETMTGCPRSARAAVPPSAITSFGATRRSSSPSHQWQASISLALGLMCNRRLPRGSNLKCLTALVM